MGKKKILIIDDDFDIRLYLAELLVSEGYKVATAKDGRAGLAYLENEQELPSLVLVDIRMPYVGGIEFRKRQKGNQRISRIPIVFMSAESIVSSQLDCHFLKKPYNLFEVMKTIERLALND